MGGSGNTPITVAIAKAMQAKGFKVVVASRGYRAKWEKTGGMVADANGILADVSEAGEEALMVAKMLPGVPVFVGKKRVEVLKKIKPLRPDLVILDDSLQHLAVARDLDLVVFDAKVGLANGRVFPAGYLREPLSCLPPEAIIVLHQKNPGDTEPLLKAFLQQKEYFEVQSRAQTLYLKQQKTELSELTGKKVSLISAIADPGSFEDSVFALGIKIHTHHVFGDHYAFEDEKEIEELAQERVDYFICTQKDAAKLKRWKKLEGRLLVLNLDTFLPAALLKKIESRLFP